MIPSLFITGTGTDVGKTHVSALFVNSLQKSKRVAYLKPIATGCVLEEGKEAIIPDAVSMRNDTKVNTFVPYAFEEPIAPYAIQKIHNISIDPQTIKETFQILQANYDFVLVEGIGGVAVPILKDYFLSDLIGELGLPVILVAHAHLGTINHTLLSIEHLKEKEIPILGFVLNHISKQDPKDLSPINNAEIITEVSGIPHLFTINFQQNFLTLPQEQNFYGILDEKE
jgi:dethiobiotin synthetase